MKLSCVKYESIPRISSRQICPKMMQSKLNLHWKLAGNRTCPFRSPLFNNNIVVHWSELDLKRPVREIRQESREHGEDKSEPTDRTRCRCLDQDLKRGCGKRRRKRTVDDKKQIPKPYASPNEAMLDPSEVVYRNSHLAIHRPDHGRVHCYAENRVINYLAIDPESLSCHCVDCEEEDDH